MASISSPGLGSGLDVNGIVSQLVELERRPITLVTEQKTALQSKLSAFGLLQSYTVNVQDAVGRLANTSLWSQTKAMTTDTSVTATSTATATAGSYAIEVGQLAQAHSIASAAYASSTASVGSGTLRIEIGTWNDTQTAFTPKSGTTAVNITIPPGASSLEDVRAAINAANAGVTASIVRDAGGARLVIQSRATGAENAVRITATADPGVPSLSALSFDPPGGVGSTTQTQAARNATAKVNGLDVSSSTNVFDNVIEGVRFTATRVTTAPVTLSVGIDKDAMRKAVDDFIKSYNEINKYITDQTRYNESTKTAAALQGDRSTLSLQSQLRQVVTGAGTASSTFRRLSDIGIEVQRDGSLKIDEGKWSAAIADPVEVGRAFATEDTLNPARDGFAVRMKKLTGQLLNTNGLVASRSEGLRESIRLKDREVERLQERVERTEARLLRQYSALDTTLARLNGLNSYVAQQVTAWNNTKNSG